MTLRAGDLPHAAASVPRLEAVARTGSTNADLLAAVEADAAAWPPYALLVTDDQTAGRGRLGRVWTAPAGGQVAASVVVDAAGISRRGWIPLAAGAAMARAVAAQLDGHTVRLKWPNDVLVDGRKICGVLAEVAPRSGLVVVGAGVNTEVPEGDLPVPAAVSFRALGRACDVDALLARYVQALREQLDALRAAGDAQRAGVHREVEALCGTLGQRVRVELPDGRELTGTAVRIGEGGELVVDTGAGEASVTAGDVVHVR